MHKTSGIVFLPEQMPEAQPTSGTLWAAVRRGGGCAFLSPRPYLTGSIATVTRPNFEEIDGYLRGLLIRLDNRLPAKAISEIGEFIDVGEPGLALELMAEALGGEALSITDDERADMLALAQRMEIGDSVSRALGSFD